jgi:hypothetical protein
MIFSILIYVKEILVFSHFVRTKYSSVGLDTKSFQLIFLTLVSIGRVFNFLGNFCEFENCLHSSVCFSFL